MKERKHTLFAYCTKHRPLFEGERLERRAEVHLSAADRSVEEIQAGPDATQTAFAWAGVPPPAFAEDLPWTRHAA